MNTKYRILLFAFIGFLVSSCNFLDKEPHELTPETYYKTEGQLKLALSGVYSILAQESFYGNYYSWHNAGGDDLSFFHRPRGKASILTADANSSCPFITKYWTTLYEGVSRANILLENVNKNKEIDKAVRERTKSEAMFLRAFYYFNLVQGWGDVPFRKTSAQSAYNLSLPRTDKQAIYDFIIQEIIDAIPALRKGDEVNPGHITQSVAKGILARIYLFRAGEHFRDGKSTDPNSQKYFAEAKKWALEVRDSGLHELVDSYDQVFIDICQDKYNSTGKRESIWEAELAGNRINSPEWSAGRIGNVIGFGLGQKSILKAPYKDLGGMKNPGYGYNFIYASLKLYEMYESEGDTIRSNWNITPYEYKLGSKKEVVGRNYYYGKRPAGLDFVDGMPCVDYYSQSVSDNNKTRCCAKYRRELEVVLPKNKNYTSINFPILRYSDVLLMIAEAENEINNAPTQLAYDCLNEVRLRADVAKYNVGDLDKDLFRKAIKKERGMELCFEGIRRWDLIRWGDFYDEMQAMRNMVNQPGWGKDYTYAANYYNVSKNYVYYPIPSLELSVNKKITKNNPGW